MLLDAETLQRSSVMDPTIAEFLSKTGPLPQLDWTDPINVQAAIIAMEQQGIEALGPIEATLSESYQEIAMRDGFQSKVKITKPTQSTSGGPLILLMFGGGFVGGTCEQMTAYSRAFARLFGAVVVNVAYRVAPQHKFPTQQNDCWDTTKWAASNAEALGADPSKGFVVGGVSAGGNTAAVVTHLALEEKLAHPITGQWLSIPSLMDDHVVPDKYKPYFQSRKQNADAPGLNATAMKAFKHFVAWDMNSSIRFPTLSKAPLSALPPTYLQADGMDPLRDDALIYDEMLKEAGVKTRIDFYPGCPHGHWNTFRGLEISTKAMADVMMGMGWLLGKSVTAEEGLKALAGSK